MVDVRKKRKQYSKEQILSPKRNTPKKVTPKDESWQSYMIILLNIATFIDTIANVSVLPMITLYSAAVPLSLWSLTLSQALFYFPQLWSSLVADRFVRRFNGITAYGTTLLATAVSLLITARALREHSLFLYLLPRLMNGFFRHTTLFSSLAVRGLPNTSRGYDTRKVFVISLISAMIVGGFFGDYIGDAAVVTDILAVMEFTIALVLIFLSFKCTFTSRALATVPTMKAYKKWLVKQSHHWIFAFAPSALSASCASMIQCMYPFIDRQVFSFGYVFIGLHMAFLIVVQVVLAPFVVKTCGKKNQWMIHTCAALIALGAWTSPSVKESGIVLYVFRTLLFVDLPAAVLEQVFSSAAEGDFKSTEKVFAITLHRHVNQTLKQWSRILLVAILAVLDHREDVMRIATLPIAMGMVSIIFTRQVHVGLAIVPLTALALVASPPLHDDIVLSAFLSPFRSMISVGSSE